MFQNIDLSVFPKEREEKLRNIFRYSMFERMMYRPNLWRHTHRLLWMLEEILPVAQKYFPIDSEKARILALVHDDPEMITGDIQAGKKERMSKEEQEAIWQQEKKAVDDLVESYPKLVHGYSYKELLLEAGEKNSIEAKLVSYVDKLDGLCESMHEVLAGNISFIRSLMFYVNALTLFPYKFPELAPLLQSKAHPLVHLRDISTPDSVKIDDFKLANKPHTTESIAHGSDFPFYDCWVKLQLAHAPKEAERWLLEQKETI